MNLDNTAEVNRSSLIKQHIMDWSAFRRKHSPDECSDERLLAGGYLAWADGSILKAIEAVSLHCSGKHPEHPAFPKCHETLDYLRTLKVVLEVRNTSSSGRQLVH